METSELSLDDSQQSPPQRATRQQYTLVLLGCSLLQLPIWGIAMTYGIFQDAYSHKDTLHSARNSTGVVGTTMNGVMYLCMPALFTLLDRGPYAHWRRHTAACGVLLSSIAVMLSSWGTAIWHLIILQGVLAALGNTMLYSPTTLYLDEWFSSERRATAYGAILSSKNIVGTGCPLLTSALIDHLGIRWALRVWAAIILGTGLLGLCIIPNSRRRTSPRRNNSTNKVPWTFLRHRTFYIHAIANLVFSSGYSLPQTYVSSYASEVLHLSSLTSSLMLTLLNAPGILSSLGFGLLSDKFSLSAGANTLIAAMGSCVCTLFLWGLGSDRTPTFLIVFSLTYGFFAGGYSATWGGWIKDLEREAAENNEAIHTGMLYGLINGARGVGYVVGGLTGLELVKAGGVHESAPGGHIGYDTRYGAVILFTGLSAAVGGWSVLWSGCHRIKHSSWKFRGPRCLGGSRI
ncbi:MFS general substrate transporter [Polychaeton citri CBS 116435]|uniref:MFS general substrate transporter n=1 Tax=Polychaeton citri CBS 116435 TaxID=1314669 RepID=A0A9P4UKJ5_9PEZI|nr:MFS general substrate transporter [Polychaeton citri CBS 116435]